MTVYVPQSVRIATLRNDYDALRSVSIPTYTLMLASATVWAIYGFMDDSVWVALSVIPNYPLALSVPYLVGRARLAQKGKP